MHTIEIRSDLRVSQALAALKASGGTIEHGLIDCPSPEAAIAGLEYVTAVHRARRAEKAEFDRVIAQFLDEVAEAYSS